MDLDPPALIFTFLITWTLWVKEPGFSFRCYVLLHRLYTDSVAKTSVWDLSRLRWRWRWPLSLGQPQVQPVVREASWDASVRWEWTGWPLTLRRGRRSHRGWSPAAQATVPASGCTAATEASVWKSTTATRATAPPRRMTDPSAPKVRHLSDISTAATPIRSSRSVWQQILTLFSLTFVCLPVNTFPKMSLVLVNPDE